MTPYEHTDDIGKLTISKGLTPNKGTSRTSHALLTVDDGDTARVRVFPDEVPRAALALYEAAGLPEPLILPAPELGGMLVRGPHGEELADVHPSPAGSPSNSPGVMLSLYDSEDPITVRLTGDEPLRVAYALVSAMRAAAGEPYPAEVEALASALCEHRGGFVENYRATARTLLLGGWGRKPDDGR